MWRPYREEMEADGSLWTDPGGGYDKGHPWYYVLGGWPPNWNEIGTDVNNG